MQQSGFFGFSALFVLQVAYLGGRSNPIKRINRITKSSEGLFRGYLQHHPLGEILERWAIYSDLPVAISGPDGAIIWVNAAFTRMCGYNSDELIGQKPGHILSGPLTDRSPSSVLNRAISQRVKVTTRILNYHKSGKPYWVDIHLEPILTSKGELSGFISIEKDVTKEERHQHDLGELSASIYGKLVETMGQGGCREIAQAGNGSIHQNETDPETPEQFMRRWSTKG
jgi:PAS domain S-box-containing protein